MCWFLFCHSIIFGMLMKRKCDANHKTVKMRSRSSDTCQTDIYTLQCIYRLNIVDQSLIVIEKQTCSWKCDASHWTMKMRSRSSDTWQTDMYTLQCIYRTNKDDLSLTVIEKQTCSWKCDANLMKSLNRNKNCSRQPYLLAKRNETKKFYRRPYMDASCQVWLHLAKQFQRRRFF